MLKECDKQSFSKNKESVIPVLVVPVKYLFTAPMGNFDTTLKVNKSEIKHSILEATLDKKEVVLDVEIGKVSYLGIIYPSGRVRLKKIRIIGRGESCYDFYCYSHLNKRQDQEELEKYERMLNKQYEI